MATTVPAEARAPRTRARTWWRRFGNTLIALGGVAVVYAAVVWFWGDPITALWARYQQAGLSRAFDREVHDWPVPATVPPSPHPKAELATVRADAHKDAKALSDSGPFGRLVIGRIGLTVIVVQGTDWWGDLSKGPGHYANTSVPGLGRTVAIAGHRTTFGAWFRHIDSIRNGDAITLQMPYATFRYRVQYHRVVSSDDWSIIRPQGYERLVLSACHPLYSASHRWVVFARAVSVTPKGEPTVVMPEGARAQRLAHLCHD